LLYTSKCETKNGVVHRIICLVACSLALVLLSACSALKPAPKIEVDQKKFDFGDVKEGVELNHTFHLRNTGNAQLNIYEAYSSCGCTTPKLSKQKLNPGETTELNVAIDTAMKQDAVTKTVFVSSNDMALPLLPIDLSMKVENLHKGMNSESGRKIFTDSHCAACHVDQGVGLVGKDLFEADCAMCHGQEAQGAVGPSLRGPYENKAYAAHIRQVISMGSKTHHSMPGFSGEAGGPLSHKQIDSIVKYLGSLPGAKKEN
jgi:mono/diheme cytochrome c family protein